jgi:hypothetical protein
MSVSTGNATPTAQLPPAILLMGPTASGKTAWRWSWPAAFRSS